MKEHGQNRTDRDTNGTFRVWKTNLMMGLTSLELERALFGNALLPWQSYRQCGIKCLVGCDHKIKPKMVCENIMHNRSLRGDKIHNPLSHSSPF